MNIKRIKILIAILMFFYAQSAIETNAQAVNSSNLKRPVEIKLDRQKLKRNPTATVTVKGKNYTFVFDSGAAVTQISPAIAQDIGCEPFGEIAGFDAGGGVHKLKRCDDVEMNVSGFVTKLDVIVGDAAAFFPKDGPQIDGFISLQTFDAQILTMDLMNDRLIVETGQSLKKRSAEMKPLKARLSRELGGYGVDMFFALSSPQGKVWMLLDTGNTNKLLLTAPAQQMLGIELDKSKEKLAKPVSVELIGYGKIAADAREREMIYDGMLNYDTIIKMLLTLDLRHGQAWAKTNSQKP